jgi:hypothetical protein
MMYQETFLLKSILVSLLVSPSAFGAVFSPFSLGESLCQGEACHRVPPKPAVPLAAEKSALPAHRTSVKKAPIPVQSLDPAPTGTNLPAYLQARDKRVAMDSSQFVLDRKKYNEVKIDIYAGDVFEVFIDQAIKASATVPTPIVGLITKGPLQQAKLIGEALLETGLRRVLLHFTQLRLADNSAIYSVKASGLSRDGTLGLEGHFVSHSGLFFIAELASAAAAGFVDASVRRNPTVFGNYAQEPSVSNAAKNAGVTALSKSTERFSEQVKAEIPYSEIAQYQNIKVLLVDAPQQNER